MCHLSDMHRSRLLGCPGPCQKSVMPRVKGGKNKVYCLNIGEEEVPKLKEMVKMAELNCTNTSKSSNTNGKAGESHPRA